MAGIHDTEDRLPNLGPVATPNPWTCPLCDEEMTGAQRADHLLGHD